MQLSKFYFTEDILSNSNFNEIKFNSMNLNLMQLT